MPTNYAEISLHLYQVLEEEYLSLHGELSPEEEVQLDSRPVVAKLDWRFHRGHIKAPDRLAYKLRGDGAKRHDLTGHLRRLLPDMGERLKRYGEARDPAILEEALNELLGRDLHDPEAFKHVEVKDSTRELVRQCARASRTTGGAADAATAHANRLLLEETFPDELERISDIRLAAMHQRLHAKRHAALCLSGGGIRSGTFALGLLQGLARFNLLKKFDYLSTVSGGGYIGGWLSAWLHRHAGGLSGVTKDLDPTDPESKVDPDSPAIRYLRDYSNFLTPKKGLFTADTWSFVAIYVRNLFLNWLVLIPLLLALLALPRLNVSLLLSQAGADGLFSQILSRPDLPFPPRYILLALGSFMLVLVIVYIGLNRPAVSEQLVDRSPFWRERRGQRSFLKWCLLPLVGAAFCLTTYWGWSSEAHAAVQAAAKEGAVQVATEEVSKWPVFVLFGILIPVAAWFVTFVILERYKRKNWKELKTDLGIFVLLIVAGAIGGGLIRYTTKLFQNPILHVPVSSSPLRVDDLKDPASLATKLRDAPEPLSQFLQSRLTPGTQQRLKAYDGSQAPPKALQQALVDELNPLLDGPSLFDEQRFAQVALSEEARRLIAEEEARRLTAEKPRIIERLRLNRLLLAEAYPQDIAKVYSWATEWYACLAVPALLLLILLATNFFVGLTSRGLPPLSRSELINDEDREWWARFNGWVLIAALVWVVFSVLAIHGPRALFYAPKLLASVGGLAGLASVLAGFSSKTPATEEQANKGGLLQTVISNYLLPLAATAFLALFLTALSLLTSFVLWGISSAFADADNVSLRAFGEAALRGHPKDIPASFDAVAHMLLIHYSAFWYVALFIVVAAAFGLFMAWRINLNRFSLHAGYRNRLIRAFLGASRARGERKANPFTSFDPADNVQMHELRPVLFHEGDFEDLEALALEIEEAKNPLSEFLKKNLHESTREWLEGYSGTAPLPQGLRAELIADLNHILESEEFVPLDSPPPGASPITKVSHPKSPQGDLLILRKRAVLQQHYPNQIRKKYPPPHRLLHVVNTALNLVGGKNLAWQQRKAEPFAVTPLHAGCFRVGYRRSRDYGGEKGISLGTAQTVSGAAASSNMGYYTTSPVLSLVLTLFNVRLGWWLGNPGPAGQTTYRREAPRLSVTPVIQEALGLTDDTNAYVYLTDGGHFENLALYEMVLRRCHLIVLSDGTGDPKFEFGDLGNAVRKIRIDLGVPIVFDEVPIHPKVPEKEGYGYWAFGHIRYSEVDGHGAPDGLLIYVKPAVYGVEPRDVIQYKVSNPDFPHQSTGDQFFDEPQFESYKTLGWHIMSRMCANAFAPDNKPSYDLDRAQFVRAARDNYNKPYVPGAAEKVAPASRAPAWLAKWLDIPWPADEDGLPHGAGEGRAPHEACEDEAAREVDN